MSLFCLEKCHVRPGYQYGVIFRVSKEITYFSLKIQFNKMVQPWTPLCLFWPGRGGWGEVLVD